MREVVLRRLGHELESPSWPNGLQVDLPRRRSTLVRVLRDGKTLTPKNFAMTPASVDPGLGVTGRDEPQAPVWRGLQGLRYMIVPTIVFSMQNTATLSRENISDAVADELRQMIIDGRLPAGQRINEVRLSEGLGVSRTPLREALNRLAAEGALTSTPRVGYFVRPLTLEEFEQLYDIRPILDPEALRLAGLPPPERIERLEELNRELAAARDPEQAIALDDAWHMELLADCPNRVLVELIQNMIQRTRRYELTLMRETRNVIRTTKDHERIMAALREKDLSAACAALKRNMQSGRASIVEWLVAREPDR